MPNENIVETRTAGTKVTEYTVYPTGDATVDPQGQTEDRMNIKFAVDNVADGGTVVLKRHRLGDAPNSVTAFNFGGDNPNMRIFITKSVTIRGDDNPTREWTAPQGWSAGVAENGGTTISGGRSLLVAGQNPATAALTPVRVSIADIRFKNFYRSAIRIFATRDQNEISGCSFVDYQVGQAGSPQGAFPFVVDSSGASLTISPDMLAGNLKISHNFIGPPPAVPDPTGINNLVHVSNCNLNLDFSNNRIEDMYWVGIAVYGNEGKTTISNNYITKSSSFKEGTAIAVGVRPSFKPEFPPEGNEIKIRGNKVEVKSGNSAGITVFLLKGDYFQPPAATPDAVHVFENTVEMLVPDGPEAENRAALACLGACSNSLWRDNIVKGSARYGIWVSDHVPSFTTFLGAPAPEMHPTDNHFQNNDLTEFTASNSQVSIAPAAVNTIMNNNSLGDVLPHVA